MSLAETTYDKHSSRMFTNVCDSTRPADTPVYNSHEFRSLDQDSREREACYSRPRVARAREHVIAKYSCALLFHVQVILELLIASFRWLKLKVTSCFSFQIVHELLNQAPPMYIFAWFRAKFQDRNWNKCRENVMKYHGTMFRSWKLNFVF